MLLHGNGRGDGQRWWNNRLPMVYTGSPGLRLDVVDRVSVVAASTYEVPLPSLSSG